jgi:hypothetical protein
MMTADVWLHQNQWNSQTYKLLIANAKRDWKWKVGSGRKADFIGSS